MPIIGTIASSRRAFTIEGSMEPIAVATVPSGGLATITFGNIPQTYTHLQLRSTVRPTIASDVVLRLNSDSTAANYYSHYINTTGTSVGSGAGGTYYGGGMGIGYHDITLANSFGVHITDILDYTNTNKNTTVRTLFGTEYNNSGGNQVAFISGAWFSTAAVTTITLYLLSGSGNVFAQNSSIALYGIKGA